MAKKPTIITKKRKGVEISVDPETKKILGEGLPPELRSEYDTI